MQHSSLQKIEVAILSFIPLPAYANNDDALLQFSMQVGSIMYTFVIVSVFVRNTRIRIKLFATYFSLTLFAYMLKLSPVIELNTILTVIVCSIVPFLTTLVLAILVGIWR